VNSKSQEDWEKNFYLLNEAFGKIKSHKTVDPTKLSQGKFTHNFELLQFVFDYVCKNCGDASIKYKAYEKRLEIIKSQYGSKNIIITTRECTRCEKVPTESFNPE
jgi:hypothetical protein